MRVQIVTAMHGRRDVFALFFAGFERLKENFDVDLHVCASDHEDVELLKALGIDYSVCENMPLGAKWNHAVGETLKKKWDRLLIMGSDDVITNEGFAAAIETGYSHVGFPGCVFYDLASGDSKVFDYRDMRVSRLSGAGRFLSRELVEMAWRTVEVYCIADYGTYIKRNTYRVSERTADYLVGTKKFKAMGRPMEGLWNPNLPHGLDLDMETTLVSMGYAPHPIDKLAICDFKNSDNMWRYDERDGKPFSFSDFAVKLSENERVLIEKMKV